MYVTDFCHHLTAGYLPDFLNFADEDIARRTFDRTDSIVERVQMFSQLGLPPSRQYDGHENLWLVARKPWTVVFVR